MKHLLIGLIGVRVVAGGADAEQTAHQAAVARRLLFSRSALCENYDNLCRPREIDGGRRNGDGATYRYHLKGRAQQGGIAERKAMIDSDHALSVTKQSEAIGIARSTVYYLPRPVSAALALMRQIDKLHTEYPFAGRGCCAGFWLPMGARSDGVT